LYSARHTVSSSSAMSFKLASVPDRPDAAPCSEEGLVVAPAAAAAAAVPVQPTVHIVATVGGEAFEFDVPADRTVEFVKAYLDNKHGCVGSTNVYKMHSLHRDALLFITGYRLTSKRCDGTIAC
jgi:hypothetical protein